MAMLAGRVHGTPDWQLDLLVESDAGKKWEEMNSPADGESLRLAARSIKWAVEDLDKACDSVNEAAETIVDTPEGDKVLSFLDEMEKTLKDLKALADEFQRRANK